MKVKSKEKNGTIDTQPCELAVQALGGKWKLILLWHLMEAPLRYGELRARVPTISERVMIRQLRELEADGLVHRKQFPVVPPHVEYSVTKASRTLASILDSLAEWADMYLTNRRDNA